MHLRRVATDLVANGAHAVLLYGSTARGEARAHSDIDLVAVVDVAAEPFEVGKAQIAPYTVHRLIEMAAQGSLFVRHLIDEAQPLADGVGIIQLLRNSYVEVSPSQRLAEVRIASGLLDVDPTVYGERWVALHACAAFLLRTLAYMAAREQGHASFSLERVIAFLGDKRLLEIKTLRDVTHPDYERFLQVSAAIADYQAAKVSNPFSSIEALTVNSWSRHDMAFYWGVRVLSNNATRLTYG